LFYTRGLHDVLNANFFFGRGPSPAAALFEALGSRAGYWGRDGARAAGTSPSNLKLGSRQDAAGDCFDQVIPCVLLLNNKAGVGLRGLPHYAHERLAAVSEASLRLVRLRTIAPGKMGQKSMC
jgi:hypothetical protein